MDKQQDKRRILYEQLTNDGYDLGDFKSFNTNLNDSTKRRNLYDAITQDNYDVGDYDSFSRNLDGKTKERTTSDLLTHNPEGSNALPPQSSMNTSGVINDNPASPPRQLNQPTLRELAGGKSAIAPIESVANNWTGDRNDARFLRGQQDARLQEAWQHGELDAINADEERRIDAAYTPKPVTSYGDIVENYSNRFALTRRGGELRNEYAAIEQETVDKYLREFVNTPAYREAMKRQYPSEKERNKAVNEAFQSQYGERISEELRPYVENLTRASGLVDCPQAYALAEKMRGENAERARLSQSRVYENLSFRANVIAWLKACVLYVAGGCRWDETIEDFVRWSYEYDMWCKMEFFGAAIEEAMKEGVSESRKGPRNLLELLPDEFTLQDAVRVRRSQGLDAEGVRNMLYQWAYRNYITILTNDNYRKLKFRRGKGR